MSMLQTLVRFLSLKSRPEEFPEAKVSGEITRTLAILNGLSNGGLRTLRADSAGQLLTRPLAMSDASEVQAGEFPNFNYIAITGKPKDVLVWSGRGVNTTYIMSVLSLGVGTPDIYAPPTGLAGYYIDPNRYVTFAGISWGRFTRFKILTESSVSGYYAAYTLPER